MIRLATAADIPALVTMGRKFHGMSHWAAIPYRDAPISASIAYLIDNHAVFVTEALDGALGVMTAPIFFSGDLMAQELFWWSDGAGALELLAEAERWAAEKGAVRFVMGRLDGLRDKALDRLYRRTGYAPIEHTYAKELS